MQLHIGEDVSIPLDRLILVLNRTGMMPDTQDYIERAKRNRRFRSCRGREKSYVLVNEHGREVVYASPIAAATLEKRLHAEIHRDWIRDCAVLTVLED